MNALHAFPERNFVADFFQAKCDFTRKTAVLRVEPILVRRGNVQCLSEAHWKARSGLPISVN